MKTACCVGVVRNSDGLKGREIEINKIPAYFSLPSRRNGKRMGVIVVHDIFGARIPNSKYIADHLANAGFDAVVPDFFAQKGLSTEGWPATEFTIKSIEDNKPDFEKFFGEITSDAYWKKFDSQILSATKFLKGKGSNKICIIGFCWGGLAVERVATTQKFSHVFSCHGCHFGVDGFKETKGRISYYTCTGDQYFTKETQDALIAAGANVQVFEGVQHGWVVRGDYQDTTVKKAADSVMQDVLAKIHQACLQKPNFTKINMLKPDSTGVNIYCKVTSAIQTVEKTTKKGTHELKEIQVGDDTGVITLFLFDEQATSDLVIGTKLALRNSAIRMSMRLQSDFMRLFVDKWGKLEKNPADFPDMEVNLKHDMSAVEYELVKS